MTPQPDVFDEGYSIRGATLDDCDALVDLIGQMARHHGDLSSTDREILARDAFGPFPWITVLVAEKEASLLGYAILCPLYRAQYGRRGMDLHHLFVKPGSRGKGIGRRLIKAALAHARSQGCRYFLIGTNVDNIAAQAFYAGLGFRRASAPGPRFLIDLD